MKSCDSVSCLLAVCLLVCWLPYISVCLYETLSGQHSPSRDRRPLLLAGSDQRRAQPVDHLHDADVSQTFFIEGSDQF